MAGKSANELDSESSGILSFPQMPEFISQRQLDRRNHELQVRDCDERYNGRTLVSALVLKLKRRVLGISQSDFTASCQYGAITVYDRPDLDGGGKGFGQDIHRALREIRPGGCERLYEFCSGPGYMGYSLLANGYCRHLVLADINPVAVQAARMTARLNNIDEKVTIYESDGLSDIDPAEKWDVVVSNPPHLPVIEQAHSYLLHDVGWKLHREFYANIKKFLNPGAVVVIQEHRLGSNAEIFRPMIEAGGGRLMRVMQGPKEDDGEEPWIYYVVSSFD
jgi:16S rRNA G966 N2-methylase RsmD